MKTEVHAYEMRAVRRMELEGAPEVQIKAARFGNGPQSFVITKLHITTWWIGGDLPAPGQQNVVMEGYRAGRNTLGKIFRYQLVEVPEWLQDLIADGTPMGITIKETK